jgi:FAD/FMN-containing dehydrogenase
MGVASRVKIVSWSRPDVIAISSELVSLDGSMLHVTDTLLAALSDAVGDRHVLTDDDVRAPYETDWTGRFHGRALAVVRPGDTAEVVAVLAACRAHGVALVPQGGNTGMVGGGVPERGEVVLSLTRLRDLGEVDRAAATVEVGAGVTLGELQAHARAARLDAAVDFAARDSATVGGMVATDAGGLRALRHGTVRARVAGVEAVLADGSVVDRRSSLLKDNAGYDLSALLVGSEGTLGVITRVRWRLVPLLAARVAALVPLESLEHAAELLAELRPRLPSLEAAEFFLDEGLQLVLDHEGRDQPPFRRAPVYVLLECAARADPTEELAEALGEVGIEEAFVADTTEERERLWRFREGHSEAIGAAGVPHKLDVGVPLARLPEFARRAREEVAALAPEARVVLFGHLADGNVHVNVLGPDPDDDRVDEAILRLTAACDGTISAEHGVGRAKARWLGLVRGPGELRAMAAIKRALDPDGMLNPGAVLPTPDAG